MKAIFYDITHTKVPSLVDDLHIKYNRGFAYEISTHYVHFYANSTGWYGIHSNLCVVEPKNGTLEDWVIKYFGAQNITIMDNEVGESVEGVWRPGLYYSTNTYQALNTTEVERKLYEQSLRILIEKLDNIFLYIEPDSTSFNTYSHKLRELLLLASTEVESSFMSFINKVGCLPLNGSTYTTKDYVRLLDVLFLNEYECTFKGHSGMPVIKPFNGWDSSSSTKSLSWYDAYNKTKHNRASNFSDANLYNVIQAVMANIVLYIVKFSPFPMQEESGTFNSLINQYFRFRLTNTNEKKHYIPLIEIPSPFSSSIGHCSPFNAGYIKPFNIKPLLLL